ncbi:uncharacterized protein LOC143228970 [Tachypleus tridentatus]|uniref:uncharacterized protein LOC143228970 n=1 Tax=Tachypleus tridentatus TaxID=6853 RepID=UPI003FD13C32
MNIMVSMTTSSVISLFLIIFAIQVPEGLAINCYTCSSRNGTDPDCHDPFNPANSTYTENCMVPKEGHVGWFPANFCLKVIGMTGISNVELVIRACVLETMHNQCGQFKYEDDTLHGCVLTCDYDACNGKPHLSPGGDFLQFHLAALVIIVWKWKS